MGTHFYTVDSVRLNLRSEQLTDVACSLLMNEYHLRRSSVKRTCCRQLLCTYDIILRLTQLFDI